jgi:hypothetical protein
MFAYANVGHLKMEISLRMDNGWNCLDNVCSCAVKLKLDFLAVVP